MVKYEIYKNAKRIADGNFGKKEVKELFIDTRELATKYREIDNENYDKSSGQNSPFGPIIGMSIEVGNYIAHGNINRGLIEDIAKNHAQKMNDVLENGGTLSDLSNFSVDNVVTLDHAVMGLAGMINESLRGEPIDLDSIVQSIFLRRSEIIVHILELMQGCCVKLKGNEGIGILSIIKNPITTGLNLYCLLYDAKCFPKILELANAAGVKINSMQFGFPVAVGIPNWPHNDCYQVHRDKFIEFESYRDEKNNLRLKEFFPKY